MQFSKNRKSSGPIWKRRDFFRLDWYTICNITGRRQSTLMALCGEKKEVIYHPRDSRCGIVETYRNASAKPGGREGAHCRGNAVRVENYGKSRTEKCKEDLPVRQWGREEKEEEKG